MWKSTQLVDSQTSDRASAALAHVLRSTRKNGNVASYASWTWTARPEKTRTNALPTLSSGMFFGFPRPAQHRIACMTAEMATACMHEMSSSHVARSAGIPTMGNSGSVKRNAYLVRRGGDSAETSSLRRVSRRASAAVGNGHRSAAGQQRRERIEEPEGREVRRGGRLACGRRTELGETRTVLADFCSGRILAPSF